MRRRRTAVIDTFDVEPVKPYDGPILALMSPYEPSPDTARLGSCHHVQVVPRSRYYAGSADLNRLIADPTGDIREVVQEVERLCRREAGASEYYREHPELLGNWHPWLEFIATGEAAYLGWEPGIADNG